MHLSYLPLDKIDHVYVGRSRSRFKFAGFLLWSLLFLVPGVLYVLYWLFFPNHTIRFNAGDGEISLEFPARKQSPMTMELLTAVEAARQALVSVNPQTGTLQEAPPPEPIQVALNP